MILFNSLTSVLFQFQAVFASGNENIWPYHVAGRGGGGVSASPNITFCRYRLGFPRCKLVAVVANSADIFKSGTFLEKIRNYLEITEHLSITAKIFSYIGPPALPYGRFIANPHMNKPAMPLVRG